MSLVRFIARPMLASSLAAGGAARLRNTEETAQQLRPYLRKLEAAVPSVATVTSDEQLVARGLGAVQLGSAVLLGLGKFSRLASLLLAGTASISAMINYKSADSSTPEARSKRRSILMRDVSLIGGVLLAAVDTAGQPSLAWRAGQMSHDVRRSARSLSKDANKQLKKAEKAAKSTASNVLGS